MPAADVDPGRRRVGGQALASAVGDASAFGDGREIVAWPGPLPRQRPTGGRPTLLGISKRGDRYLRTLLIHGARSADKGRLARQQVPCCPGVLVGQRNRRHVHTAPLLDA